MEHRHVIESSFRLYRNFNKRCTPCRLWTHRFHRPFWGRSGPQGPPCVLLGQDRVSAQATYQIEERKIKIFSQFTTTLDVIQEYLNDYGYPFEVCFLISFILYSLKFKSLILFNSLLRFLLFPSITNSLSSFSYSFSYCYLLLLSPVLILLYFLLLLLTINLALSHIISQHSA